MPQGPACPDCGKLAPFIRTQWNLGRPFACARCGTVLEVRKVASTILGFILFTIFWFGRPHFPAEWGGQFAFFALILLIGIPLAWLLTGVRRVDR